MDNKRQSWIVAAALTCLLASGCGGAQTDARLIEISNGKIYKAGEAEPFSGTVTNFPELQMPFSAGLNDLLVRINRAKDQDPRNTLFGAKLMCTVNTRQGILDGKIVCFKPQSDIVRYTGFYESGMLNGPLQLFDHTGERVLLDAEFTNGTIDGELTLFSPKTGKMIYHATSKMNKLDGKAQTFDENTGQLVYVVNAVNGVFEGQAEGFSPTGAKTYNGQYENGKRVGAHEEFDPETGKRTALAHYRDNYLNGAVTTWDKDGNLLSEKTYDNGREIQSSTPIKSDESGAVTYDVWCNPRSDNCDYQGQSYPREELQNVIPIKKTEWCDMMFCYSSDSYEHVVGTAPQ